MHGVRGEIRHETRIVLRLIEDVEKCLLHLLALAQNGQVASGIVVVRGEQALVLWRHRQRLLLLLIASGRGP